MRLELREPVSSSTAYLQNRQPWRGELIEQGLDAGVLILRVPSVVPRRDSIVVHRLRHAGILMPPNATLQAPPIAAARH
jgi:hypothetical protein